MAVMGSPHGSVVWQNKLTMFGAHCPFNPLVQLAESKGDRKADYACISNASDSGSIGDKCVPQLCEDNPQTLGRLMSDSKLYQIICRQGVKK